jgi:Na+/H+ antiporter NhaD/arsenite permease-like protein
MNVARVLVASIVILGLSTSAFAGDLAESIAKAVQEQTPREQARPPKIPKSYLIPGATLFVVGMGMVVYGFLHTSGGEFVSGSVSTESKTEIGGAGLAVAGAGGAILLLGAHQAKHAPSVLIGPNHFSVSKRVSW